MIYYNNNNLLYYINVLLYNPSTLKYLKGLNSPLNIPQAHSVQSQQEVVCAVKLNFSHFLSMKYPLMRTVCINCICSPL